MLKKFTVLFLNHHIKQCGVYQYGLRLYTIIKNSPLIDYIYEEVKDYSDYMNVLKQYNSKYQVIIYNYHINTMYWLNSINIQKQVHNIGMAHESNDSIFDIKLDLDPLIPDNLLQKRFSIPRPIFENVTKLLEAYTPSTKLIQEFIEYSESGVPIIGSFGFGFMSKGFHKIVELVNVQFQYAIIKFLIPNAQYDQNGNNTIRQQVDACVQCNTSSNIKLMFSHEFFTNEDILLFLQSNTVNMFMYDTLSNRGISSAIDYALSVPTPLIISNSAMFRHIYNDAIALTNNKTIQESIADIKNQQYCTHLREQYSHANLITKLDTIILTYAMKPKQSRTKLL